MATELTDDVWRIRCRGVNAYLLDREETVLVDAGTPLDAGRIQDGVAEAGHALADVDLVVATHFDADHVGALWRLDQDLHAPLHMPEPDLRYLTREDSPPRSRKGVLQRALRVLVRPPDLPVEAVSDGEEVAGLTAHRTPGHTPGHTVYASGVGELAFLGDLVFGDGTGFDVPPGIVNEDTDRVGESIRAFAGGDHSFAVGCQGHGDPVVEDADAALAALADELSG